MKLMKIKIKDLQGIERLSWAEGMSFTIPVEVFSYLKKFIDSDGYLTIKEDIYIPQIKSFAEKLRVYSAFTQKKPLSCRLPFSYQKIPPSIRSLIASVTARSVKNKTEQWARFPSWPIDLSVDFLFDLSQENSPVFLKKTPVLITHDIDTQEGLKNLVALFLEIEESFGIKSINFIVPCGWKIEYSLLDEIHKRGHEIGIHGYDHSNKTAFLCDEEKRKRLSAALHLIERYRIKGYRAPSLLRTSSLLRVLSEFYSYDSSIPTSGGPFPVPNNGCATARPFIIEGIIEIPLTLPRDGSLIFMGYKPEEILRLWIEVSEKISRSGGVVVLLTHCERRFSGSKKMLEIYRDFLSYLKESPRYFWATSEEIIEAL